MAAYRARILARPAEERLRMAFDLHTAVRNLMRVGILLRAPQASEAEIEQEIFMRFYGDELDPPQRERLLARIAVRYRQPSSGSST